MANKFPMSEDTKIYSSPTAFECVSMVSVCIIYLHPYLFTGCLCLRVDLQDGKPACVSACTTDLVL